MSVRGLVIVVLSLIACNVMAGELTIPEDKAVIQFENKLGTVTFAHQKHADLTSTQCTTCHHSLLPEDTAIQPCHVCHLHDSKTLPKAKTVFHKRCTGCHEYTAAGGENAGPLKKKCRLCHIKQ